ncbi:hypothetical protein M0R72_12550 [Candidatus Pacearchaeota archaeon]|jgi:hypothetical protein|nr:hypothetical protein [Candidatus Pacearchaeota archaeon]
MPINNGWKCPGCGRCYAPHVSECKACNAKVASGVKPTMDDKVSRSFDPKQTFVYLKGADL